MILCEYKVQIIKGEKNEKKKFLRYNIFSAKNM